MDQFKYDVQMDQKAKQAVDINLLNMIESRIMEIIQIEDECKKKLPKLYNQRLQRFMRRRAASHNIKRLPKRIRSATKKSDEGEKSKKKEKQRKCLLRYRRRSRFQKHKRVLKRHGRHNYKDPNKSLLHKWFAKRFKMGKTEPLLHVPLHNNTKNQRNLYRQARYGCAYLSLAHLIPLQITLSSSKDGCHLENQLKELNRLTNEVSGFTFCARALEKGNYEIAIHLNEPDVVPRQHICSTFASLSISEKTDQATVLTLWVPKEHYAEVLKHLDSISEGCTKKITINRIHPREWTRIRLIGPNAREESMKISLDAEKHKLAINDADLRLDRVFGISIGRCVEEKVASFTYYNTYPKAVDVVFRTKEGRMLWHKLIKNKAHLVGGHRDLERLLVADCFKLIPDCE